MPFIFANFNGTNHDIGVFTHEMGHAFQNWESRDQPGIDYLWPTMEAAEINSMGLEFLTHPQMGLLVGDDEADRFRRMHLISSLAFLPYGVCVDHFQHEVYANPDRHPGRAPRDLAEDWNAATCHGPITVILPTRRWAGCGRRKGISTARRSTISTIRWRLCCALQFWVKSRQDYAASLDAYVALCARGGAAPFQDLVRGAGLVSPFAPGALAAVVREAETVLAA